LKSRLSKRADRVRQEIKITRVLADLGYAVLPDAEGREQQFSCDLHGDGRDSKKSARAYPSSNSCYCWACGRARDSISLVRDKTGASFADAVKWLETKYGLPYLPWEGPEEGEENNTQKAVLQTLAQKEPSVEEGLSRLTRMLELATLERALPAFRAAAYWEARDKVAFLMEQGSKDRIGLAISTLRAKLEEEIRGEA
jgi:hypothetical protein